MNFETTYPATVRSEGTSFTNAHPLVLIVENEPAAQNLLKAYIKNAYDVIFAESGEEALDIITKYDIAAIIMDIGLDGKLTGIETTELIQQMPGKKEIPIIAMTAYSHEEISKQCMKAGCTAFILKPSSRQYILDCLERYAGHCASEVYS